MGSPRPSACGRVSSARLPSSSRSSWSPGGPSTARSGSPPRAREPWFSCSAITLRRLTRHALIKRKLWGAADGLRRQRRSDRRSPPPALRSSRAWPSSHRPRRYGRPGRRARSSSSWSPPSATSHACRMRQRFVANPPRILLLQNGRGRPDVSCARHAQPCRRPRYQRAAEPADEAGDRPCHRRPGDARRACR